jgi:hypothetical protein
VNHSTRRLLALERGARRLVDVDVLQVDVVRAAQREVQHAGADRVVGQRSIRMKPPVSRLTV